MHHKKCFFMTLANQYIRVFPLVFGLLIAGHLVAQKPAPHKYNGSYSGDYLQRVAFPIGGMGAGMFCLEGTGAISHMSIHHRPEIYNEPAIFAAISVKGNPKGAKVLEGPVPTWKHFGPRTSGQGQP